MRHLLDLFFSKGEIMNSMTWDFFIDQIEQNMNHDFAEFHELLVNFIKHIAENCKSFESPNILGLFEYIKKCIFHLKSHDFKKEGEERLKTQLLLVSASFFRMIVEITTFSTPEGYEFDIIFQQNSDYHVFLDSCIQFIILAPLNDLFPSVINEFLITLMITCFSVSNKSAMKAAFQNFTASSENESTVITFLYKLIQIIALNGYVSEEAGWSSYIFNNAKKLTGLISFGLVNTTKPEKLLSAISRHSCFIFCYMVYCADDHGVFARQFVANLCVEKDYYTYPKLSQPKNDSEEIDFVKIISQNPIKCHQLFWNFARYINSDVIGLVFYSLARDNSDFLSLFIESPFADQIVLNLSRIIYNSKNLTLYSTSMILIILLSLTTNQSFVDYLHAKSISNLVWLSEQHRTDDWSASNVVLLCLLKGLKYNHFHSKYVFAQENYIGNIINLSYGQVHLNNEVCSFLASFLSSCISEFTNLSKDQTDETAVYNKNTLERIIGCLLQLINLVLMDQLGNNPYLIHHLILLKQNDCNFDSLNDIPSFQEELVNIITLVNFYQYKFSQVIEHSGTIDPTKIIENIRNFTQNSSIIISYSKPRTMYEFHEDSSSNLFFQSYLKVLCEDEDLTWPSHIE